MPQRIVCVGDSISDGFTYQLMVWRGDEVLKEATQASRSAIGDAEFREEIEGGFARGSVICRKKEYEE